MKLLVSFKEPQAVLEALAITEQMIAADNGKVLSLYYCFYCFYY